MNTVERLIEPARLAEILHDPNLLIVDLCSDALYSKSHVPGAVHVSPAELVSGQPPATGRLPDEARLEQLFTRLGLTPEKRVIAYDDEGGGWAGRFIWTLDVIGHDNWSYLNGGFVAWSKEGFPVTDEIPETESISRSIQIDVKPIAEVGDVLRVIGNPDSVIWDARSAAEYRGERVAARRAGHIPGAINLDWLELMDPSRNLRLQENLADLLASRGITGDKSVITHCQTHHRSGLTYLAARILDFPRIKAYHGSWSEWGNRDDTPIEL
ncbi:MAG: sulfurtransferase [bacterium]